MARDFVSVIGIATVVDCLEGSDVARVARGQRPIGRSVAIHRIDLDHIPIENPSVDYAQRAGDFVIPASRSKLALVWSAKALP
jgi:hypothetical protein